MSTALKERPLPARWDEEEPTLFSDLLAEMPIHAAPIPLELRPYMGNARRSEIRQEAESLLAWWLNRMQKEQVTRLGTEPDVALPCAEPDVIDSFVPDWPEPEDYPDGADDEGYLAAYRSAEIARARAKQVCFERCPLRTECLARSMKIDPDYLEPGALDVHAVLGGWGPGARQNIYLAFRKRRHNYLNRSTAETLQLASE